MGSGIVKKEFSFSLKWLILCENKINQNQRMGSMNEKQMFKKRDCLTHFM